MRQRVVKLSETEFVPQIYHVLTGWTGVTKGLRVVYTKEAQLQDCVVNSESLAELILDNYTNYTSKLEKLN